MQTLKLLGVAMLAVTVLDFIWLGLVMPRFYDQQLGEIARRSGASLAPRWSAAIIVYVLIPLGVVLFVRPLFTPTTTLWQALAWGALYGLILYGTYDFTNLATLEKWNWKLALIDTAWGAAICGLTSVAVKAALDWMNKA
ncbi:DUF2177 family protein [Planctomicrobium piriforme]|uniref:Uncharacterized membrane protein n=1 Tax=Planctomicrobium piriforme TaxID=1576369 RepID=A0A1I3FAQ7_9PLAN|nr:DUF2177 family protein [Planctomicrobium piriforme]SFI08313.1 Uncharacterized membrane protein [Planctomicrobium piriforme]